MAISMSPLVANESPHLEYSSEPASESLVAPLGEGAEGWRCGRSERQVLFLGRRPPLCLASRMR